MVRGGTAGSHPPADYHNPADMVLNAAASVLGMANPLLSYAAASRSSQAGLGKDKRRQGALEQIGYSSLVKDWISGYFFGNRDIGCSKLSSFDGALKCRTFAILAQIHMMRPTDQSATITFQ